MKTKPFSPATSSGRLRLRFLPAWALMAVSAAMLGGCQVLPTASPDATRFYVLSSTQPTNAVAEPAERRWQVALRAIDLPGYLRATKSIVVREGGNELRYQDFNRWAESLDAGISRLLVERLRREPSVRGVTAYPTRGDIPADYEVVVRVVRCEGVAGSPGQVRFEALYSILATDGTGRIAEEKTYVAPPVTWDGRDFSALAAAVSAGVEELAARIAADLPK